MARKGIIVRSKEEKRKIKRLKEKEKKLKKKRRLGKILNELGDNDEDFKEFEDFQDEVKFNDIAHAPPSLKGLPKKKKQPNETVKKNKNSTLLLAQKLKSDKPEISLARQHMLNQERVRVIQAYRSLKSNQQTKAKVPWWQVETVIRRTTQSNK